MEFEGNREANDVVRAAFSIALCSDGKQQKSETTATGNNLLDTFIPSSSSLGSPPYADSLECNEEAISSPESARDAEDSTPEKERYLYPHDVTGADEESFRGSLEECDCLEQPEVEYIRPGCYLYTYFTGHPKRMVDLHFQRSLLKSSDNNQQDATSSNDNNQPLEYASLENVLQEYPDSWYTHAEFPNEVGVMSFDGNDEPFLPTQLAHNEIYSSPPVDPSNLLALKLRSPPDLTFNPQAHPPQGGAVGTSYSPPPTDSASSPRIASVDSLLDELMGCYQEASTTDSPGAADEGACQVFADEISTEPPPSKVCRVMTSYDLPDDVEPSLMSFVSATPPDPPSPKGQEPPVACPGAEARARGGGFEKLCGPGGAGIGMSGFQRFIFRPVSSSTPDDSSRAATFAECWVYNGPGN